MSLPTRYRIKVVDKLSYEEALELSTIRYFAMQSWTAIQYIQGPEYNQLSPDKIHKQFQSPQKRLNELRRQAKMRETAIRSWARKLMVQSWRLSSIILVAYDDEVAVGRAIGYVSWHLPSYMVDDEGGGWKKGSLWVWNYSKVMDWINRGMGKYEDPMENERGRAYVHEHYKAHHSAEMSGYDIRNLPAEELYQNSIIYPTNMMVLLKEIVVLPSFQRRGVGSILIAESFKEDVIPNIPVPLGNKVFAPQRIYLWSSPAGKRLFESLGFLAKSEHVSHEGTITTTYMEMLVPPE